MKKINKRQIVDVVLRIERALEILRRRRKIILLLLVVAAAAVFFLANRKNGMPGGGVGEDVGAVLSGEARDLGTAAQASLQSEMSAEAVNIARLLASLGHSQALNALRLSGEAPRGSIIFKVPGDFDTIQQAIDAAISGDTVMVAAGTYKENIVMKSGVSVVGEHAETTILDGDKKGNVVVFKNISDKETRLENFSIKNAETNLSGVLIENSSPLINRNIIFGNDYAIYIKGVSSPTIQRNILEQNKAGVQVFNLEKVEDSNPLILDNLIYANKKGINLYNGRAVIEHNTISYNGDYGLEAGATFGIYLTASAAVIRNNIITDNGSCEICSGVYADDKSADVELAYNDIWNNRNDFSCYGGCVLDATNFSEDPIFENGLLFDFRLKAESPLLGRGSDGQRLGARL